MTDKTTKTKQAKRTGKTTAAKSVSVVRALGAKLKTVRIAAPLAVVAMLLILAVVIAAVRAENGGSAAGDKPADGKAVQEQLRGQVDAADGSPRSGRDPATQQQNSLSAAASRPTGVSASEVADRPASGVSGSHGNHATYNDVYDDPNKTGIGTNGCFIDYGKPGEQCLPVHAAGDDRVPTCSEVRKYFPEGIVVSGTDRFHLDHNGDKLACGPNE
jgi:hypothetical protein